MTILLHPTHVTFTRINERHDLRACPVAVNDNGEG